MRAAEFYAKINELNFQVEEFYILGGGALLLYGIRQETSDIDLCVSMKLFNTLKDEGKVDLSSENRSGFFKLTGKADVEVVPNCKTDFKCVKFGDLYLEDIREMLNYKKKRNLRKDKKDIEAIECFLQKYPNYPEF